jgi:IclR family transcriptional regulator, acetate operon repressor
VADTPPRGTLGTVHNAALLLELLSTGAAHQPLTDLADRSGMSLPTLHRLLRSLVAAGLVEQDPRSSRYGLGPGLARLAEQYRTRLPVAKVASPYLVELRVRTGGTARLITLVGPDAVEIDRVDGDDVGGVFRDGSRVHPALDSAAGRLLLARADDETWKLGTAYATAAPSDADRRAWADTRYLTLQAQHAVDRGEVAAPVVVDDTAVVAALSLSGPSHVLTPADLDSVVAPQVLRAAAAISGALGHG